VSASRFPIVTPEVRKQRLALPSGRRRLVIDTDTANEIDDQFTLAWALQSPDLLDVEAVLVEPYSFAHLRQSLLDAADALEVGDGEPSGMVDSFTGWAARLAAADIDVREIPFPGPDAGVQQGYDEAVRVYEKVGVPWDGKVFLGSERYLPSATEPVESPAVDRLIELAMEPSDSPLYVVAIGCVTNVASAILKEPEIINNIVVLWTAGYPSWSPRSNLGSLNLDQDVAAAHVLFDSGVPLVYFPGFYMGAQLRLSLPEMETWVRGKGAIGDYLHHLYTNNPLHAQRGIFDHFGRTWVIWDMITIAWLLEPAWVPTELVATPTLDEDLYWVPAAGPERLMREAHGIDRDAIFRDFFRKLEDPPQ
jgi:purine nucleosidase